jgi:hypothetical protein
MPAKPSSTTIPLPQARPSQVMSAILDVIGVARYSIVYTRSWAVDSANFRLSEKVHDLAHGWRRGRRSRFSNPRSCSRRLSGGQTDSEWGESEKRDNRGFPVPRCERLG